MTTTIAPIRTAPFRWEDRVQARTVTFWKSVPYAHVYDLSQGVRGGGKKHATTRQTEGLPDLIVVLERFNVTRRQSAGVVLQPAGHRAPPPAGSG